MFVYVTGVEE